MSALGQKRSLHTTVYRMYREPFEAKCEDAAEPSRVWKPGHGFLSQWLAE